MSLTSWLCKRTERKTKRARRKILIKMDSTAGRLWSADELRYELRIKRRYIDAAVEDLQRAGFITVQDGGTLEAGLIKYRVTAEGREQASWIRIATRAAAIAQRSPS